jgi:RND family efflux transporter MFP subunit
MNIKNQKTIFSYLCAPVIMLLMCTTPAKGFEMPEILVEQAKIENYNFYSKFTAIGQCKSEHSKSYYAKVAGTIDSIAVNQGENVFTGNVLITIDEDMAKASKARAEAALNSAQTTHTHNLTLLEKKIIGSEVANKSEVALETAKSELTKAQDLYRDMIITAPYDSYIGVVNARVGDDVKIGDYLFSLIANGEKTVFVELPENMYSKIDQKSLIYTKDIDGNRIQGDVVAVSNYLNDNGTITAKISFPEKSKLIHGSYIEVELIFNQHQGLSVPEKAILKNNDGNFIYKITEENKAQQVYVTTGERTDDMIEIISGDVQNGNAIIVSGLTKVFDGADVKLKDEMPTEQENKN